jgi:hypothetical protein
MNSKASSARTSSRVSTRRQAGRLPGSRRQPRQFRFQDFSTKNQQRAQRLGLGGGTDVALHRQRGEKRLHFPLAHFVDSVYDEIECTRYPYGVCCFGTQTVVIQAQARPNMIEQFQGVRPGSKKRKIIRHVNEPYQNGVAALPRRWLCFSTCTGRLMGGAFNCLGRGHKRATRSLRPPFWSWGSPLPLPIATEDLWPGRLWPAHPEG